MRDGDEFLLLFSSTSPSRPLLHTHKKKQTSSPCPSPRLPAAPLPAPRRRPAVRAGTLEASTGLQRAPGEGGRTSERSIIAVVGVVVLARVVAARLALPMAPRDARLVRRGPRDAAGPRGRLLGSGRGPAGAGLGRVPKVRFLPCQRRRCRRGCCRSCRGDDVLAAADLASSFLLLRPFLLPLFLFLFFSVRPARGRRPPAALLLLCAPAAAVPGRGDEAAGAGDEASAARKRRGGRGGQQARRRQGRGGRKPVPFSPSPPADRPLRRGARRNDHGGRPGPGEALPGPPRSLVEDEGADGAGARAGPLERLPRRSGVVLPSLWRCCCFPAPAPALSSAPRPGRVPGCPSSPRGVLPLLARGCRAEADPQQRQQRRGRRRRRRRRRRKRRGALGRACRCREGPGGQVGARLC